MLLPKIKHSDIFCQCWSTFAISVRPVYLTVSKHISEGQTCRVVLVDRVLLYVYTVSYITNAVNCMS